jgi:peptidoglycan pentaglycine glycine transferase (the first glycine)
MILRKHIEFGPIHLPLSVFYVPKGPILNWDEENAYPLVLEDLVRFSREQGAIFVKIDPDVVIGSGILGKNSRDCITGLRIKSHLQKNGWVFSSEQIQFHNTMTISLEPDESTLLNNMKQKTRYNIRLAVKKGVTVRVGDEMDLPNLYQLYANTSLRDGFVIREPDYYYRLWGTLLKSNYAEILIAQVDEVDVGAVFITRFARKAYYMYGMSLEAHRDKMHSYLLQWEAIIRAKLAGCEIFDMWGAPDVFDESDPMWGVYRFKEGFGGQVIRTIGAWDYPIHPKVYQLYTILLPKMLSILRRRGFRKTKEMIRI